MTIGGMGEIVETIDRAELRELIGYSDLINAANPTADATVDEFLAVLRSLSRAPIERKG